MGAGRRYLFDPCTHWGMIIIQMNPSVSKKFLLFFIFLLTFYFSPPTSFLYAGYSNSVNDGITDGINNRTGKFSIGLEAGYTKQIYGRDCDTHCMSTPVLGLNFGYRLSKSFEAGLGFQYYVNFQNHDSDGGHDISTFTFVPQVKFRVLESSLTPTLGAGFGLGLPWEKSINRFHPFPWGYLSGGIEYQFEKHISLGVDLKWVELFLLMPEVGLQISF